MKKYSFIALAIIAGILPGCTHKELLPGGDPFNDAPWAVDRTLPVPINLGTGDIFQIETKSSESPVSNAAALEGKHFAVTAIAKSDSDRAADFSQLTSAVADPSSESRLLLNSAYAKCAGGKIAFVDGAGNAISKYYPQPASNETHHLYSFYAYRCLPEGTESYESAMQLGLVGGHLSPVINFELEPESHNVDVLWAFSGFPTTYTYSGVDYDGYNAAFARAARLGGDLADNTPSLSFSHLASCIHIKVKVAGNTASERLATLETLKKDALLGDTSDFLIDSIRISGIEAHLSMNIQTGELARNTAQESTLSTLFRIEGSQLIPVLNSTATDVDPVEYGTGVFILPRRYSDSATPLHIKFRVTDKVGNVSWKETDLPWPTARVYEPGYSYTYYIVINSVESVSINASVESYTDYSGTFEDEPPTLTI